MWVYTMESKWFWSNHVFSLYVNIWGEFCLDTLDIPSLQENQWQFFELEIFLSSTTVQEMSIFRN